jgi:hypothetical protein
MKKLFLILTLLPATLLFAEKPSSNPADFPITVHVVRSRQCSVGGYSQHLDAIIDGQQVELERGGIGVLALGDYKAQVFTTKIRNPNPSDVFRNYRLLLADGSTRDFMVVGLGPMEDGSRPKTAVSSSNP